MTEALPSYKIKRMAKTKRRFPYEEAKIIARRILETSNNHKISIGIFGSYIRKEEDIGDLDVLAFEEDCDTIRKLLQKEPFFSLIDLYCIPNKYHDSWETFALYLTGSGAFNIWMRSLARNKGYLLNQYGLFKRDSGKLISTKEVEIFNLLGVDYIAPELRSEKYNREWKKYLKK